MRYGRRETSLIESRGHRSHYKQCNRAFPVWGIFSWRANESRSLRSGRFHHSSKGLWETFIFLLFPRIINVIKGKVGESISTIIIVAPLLAIMTPSSSEFGITATTAIGWGQEEGMDEDTAMWKEGVRVRSFMEAQKGKKILFERLFSRNKKINALTEVKENQYLTASGIKFFQKQTAGNNCPVCMTDRLNVRLRATEIRFA